MAAGSDLDSGRAAEIRAGEWGGKEVLSPLQQMQSVLRMTAHRLVILEAMTWAQRQVESKGQRWSGLLKREKARGLRGGRCVFFQGDSAATSSYRPTTFSCG